MKFNKGISLSVIAMSVALALSGCGDKKEGGEEKATQVAAKVNGEEITVHQLNFAMQRMGNIPPEQTKQAGNQVVKMLVDQQVVVQKAIEDKLDRDPNVVQALDAAKRQILSQAYMARITNAATKPTDAEIEDYYGKHPELFSERRVYQLVEFKVEATPENLAAVKAKLSGASAEQFLQWMQANKIQFKAGRTVVPAEKLPLEAVAKLHALKDGDSINVQVGNVLDVVFRQASQLQPVAKEQAKPMIEAFLLQQRKKELVDAEVKKLREAAKIEYLGEYAEAGKAEPAAPASAPEKAEAPAAAEQDDAMAKGLQGLK